MLFRDVGTSSRITDVSSMLEYERGCTSSNDGTFASHVSMPPSLSLAWDVLWPLGVLLSLGLFLPLRGVSPRAGSNESGRGIVVLFACCDDEGAASLEMAVIHDLSKRTA